MRAIYGILCGFIMVLSSEISRNSVLISGFEHEKKALWLGDNYRRSGPSGNDINKTNLPDFRLKFRHDTLEHELLLIEAIANHLGRTPVPASRSTLYSSVNPSPSQQQQSGNSSPRSGDGNASPSSGSSGGSGKLTGLSKQYPLLLMTAVSLSVFAALHFFKPNHRN